MDSLDLAAPTYVRLREQLRRDVIAGRWPLGRHVTLAALVSHYGVGMNPVREALLQLQGEGIVEMRAHRGTVIPRLDAAQVAEVYAVRSAIDVMLVGEAAGRATQRELDAVGELVEAHATAAREGAAAAVAANRALHLAINTIAGNRYALTVLAGRSSLVDALRGALGYGEGRLERVIAQHRDILRALRRRDAAAARSAMARHADDARADLLRRIAAAPQPDAERDRRGIA